MNVIEGKAIKYGDRSLYMKQNIFKYTTPLHCDVCNGKFDVIHRARHFRSDKHCKAVAKLCETNAVNQNVI